MVKLRRLFVTENYNLILESKKDLDDLKKHLGDDLYNDYMKIRDRISDSEWKDFQKLKKKDPDEIKDFVDNFQSKSDKRKSDKISGAKKIYSDDDWDVYKITSYPAAQLYGKGTKWCITGRYAGHESRGEEYFNAYIDENNLDGGYYFYINKNNPSKKYCVLQRKDKTIHSIWNAEDNMEGTSMVSLNVRLPEIPEVNLKQDDYTIDGLCDLCIRKDTDLDHLKDYIKSLQKKEGKDIVNKIDSIGRTPLGSACRNNNLDMIKLLVDSGADINVEDGDDRSPLYLAISTGHTIGINKDVLQYLIKKGAKVDNNLMDSLIRILRFSSMEPSLISSVLKLLVKGGLDINAKNWCGKSPINQVIELDNSDVLRSFIKNGADVNTTDSFGVTPILCTINNDDLSSRKDILKLLIKNGANVDKSYSGGITPLINCVKYSDKINKVFPLIKLLVENGADVNAQDSFGNTALHYAMKNSSDSPSIIKYLIDHGASLDIENDSGWTPIDQPLIPTKLKNYLSTLSI